MKHNGTQNVIFDMTVVVFWINVLNMTFKHYLMTTLTFVTCTFYLLLFSEKNTDSVDFFICLSGEFRGPVLDEQLTYELLSWIKSNDVDFDGSDMFAEPQLNVQQLSKRRRWKQLKAAESSWTETDLRSNTADVPTQSRGLDAWRQTHNEHQCGSERHFL